VSRRDERQVAFQNRCQKADRHVKGTDISSNHFNKELRYRLDCCRQSHGPLFGASAIKTVESRRAFVPNEDPDLAEGESVWDAARREVVARNGGR